MDEISSPYFPLYIQLYLLTFPAAIINSFLPFLSALHTAVIRLLHNHFHTLLMYVPYLCETSFIFWLPLLLSRHKRVSMSAFDSFEFEFVCCVRLACAFFSPSDTHSFNNPAALLLSDYCFSRF